MVMPMEKLGQAIENMLTTKEHNKENYVTKQKNYSLPKRYLAIKDKDGRKNNHQESIDKFGFGESGREIDFAINKSQKRNNQ